MKNYLTIMKEQLAKVILKDKKPDLSIKDWKFVLECLVALENIYNDLDNINAEYFKDKCVMNFEVLEDITGHKIFEEEEEAKHVSKF